MTEKTKSVRDKLNENKTGVGVGAVLLIVAALAYTYYYWNSGRVHVNATQTYYSDDDGASYYKDTTYNFPPYTHDGKTAVKALIGESGSHTYVALLLRYTPSAQKQLQQAYDKAVKNNGSVQETVIGLMNTPGIAFGGMEAKLPGSGHNWVPRGQIHDQLKSPSGDQIERFVDP